jgi:hypothetical protein
MGGEKGWVSFGFIRHNRETIPIVEDSPQKIIVHLKIAGDAALSEALRMVAATSRLRKFLRLCSCAVSGARTTRG